MKLFVTGEGANEIGKWIEHPSYRSSSKRGDGVLAALVRKKREAAMVVDGMAWKNARHFRAGVARGDAHTLAAHALTASEAGADALVWARDTDGDVSRVKELKAKQEELRAEFRALKFIGGLPNQAWVMAIGRLDVDPESRSKERLKKLAEENDCASESRMCQLINDAQLDGLESSASLREFMTAVND